MANSDLRDWHRADIKAALEKSAGRWSSKRLSEAHGYHHTAVSEALKRPWPAMERIIANVLGLEPWDIWPSRYDAKRQPKRGVPTSKLPPRPGPFSRPGRRSHSSQRKVA